MWESESHALSAWRYPYELLLYNNILSRKAQHYGHLKNKLTIIWILCQVGSQRCPVSAIRSSRTECLPRLYICKVCLEQVMLMLRSCAIKRCEPCQGLIAAALSRLFDVPRGSFSGVNYSCSTWVYNVEEGCTVFRRNKK